MIKYQKIGQDPGFLSQQWDGRKSPNNGRGEENWTGSGISNDDNNYCNVSVDSFLITTVQILSEEGT